jgi:WD40 repeat protein
MAEGFITRRGGAGALEITGQQVFTGTAAETIAQFDTISVDEVNKHINKLDNPSTLPPSTGRGVSFSPDGVYLAVAHNNSPFITIYKRSGDTFTKLDNPATLPPNTGRGVSFSPDGVYLAVAHFNSPFITIYKRSGDTFTKLANPSTLPPQAANSTAFSSDGTYLAVAHNTSAFITFSITIYKRDGDTFTKLDNPATLPTGQGNSTAFSPDGVYLAVAHSNSPFITIYKRSGDTFTKLDNPSILPPIMGLAIAFSPDGVYLAVGYSSISPYIIIYKRSGDTFTKLDNPPYNPLNDVLGITFSPDGVYLSVVHGGSPLFGLLDYFITIYKRDGDTFTKLSNPANFPTGTSNGIAFSLDGVYLSVAHNTSPFITIYKTDPTKDLAEVGITQIFKANNRLKSPIFSSNFNINEYRLGYANEAGNENDEIQFTEIFRRA